ncbi:MAG: hypothetical protein ABFR62_10605 [Bacteroidota bacterium]
MISSIKKYIFSVLILLAGNNLFAHEGHGNYEDSLLHYFYSLEHIALIAIAIVALIALFRLYKRVKA